LIKLCGRFVPEHFSRGISARRNYSCLSSAGRRFKLEGIPAGVYRPFRGRRFLERHAIDYIHTPRSSPGSMFCVAVFVGWGIVRRAADAGERRLRIVTRPPGMVH